jgi:hypothetical protein
MIAHSAAASTVTTMEWYFNSPIYQSMPAPYLWYEPSRLSMWTAQPGALVNLGTLAGATFNTNPSYLVQASAANPASGSALYQIDDSTQIDGGTTRSSLRVTPAADIGPTSLVVVAKSVDGIAAGSGTPLVGMGGIALTYKDSGGSPKFTAGIYQPTANTANNVSIAADFPDTGKYRCYIITFTPEPNTYVRIYQNGTLKSQGEMGYSYATYATSNILSIVGFNRYFYGSIMRFNYALSSDQASIINTYLSSIWGPF